MSDTLDTEHSCEVETPPCPLCGVTESRHLFTGQDYFYRRPGRFSFRRCCRCDLAYLSPRPTKAAIASFYPSDYYAYGESSVSETVEPVPNTAPGGEPTVAISKPKRGFLQTMRRGLGHCLPNPSQDIMDGMPLGAPASILDVGCGRGEFLDRVARLGWSTYGVDLSEAAIKRVNAAGHTGMACDIETFPVLPRTFDVIRMWHSLEHMYDPMSVLRYLRGALAADGQLLIGVPNERSYLARRYRKHWLGWDVPRHTLAFNPRTLRELLQRSGYRQIEVHIYSERHCLKLCREWQASDNDAAARGSSGSSPITDYYLLRVMTALRWADLMTVVARP